MNILMFSRSHHRRGSNVMHHNIQQNSQPTPSPSATKLAGKNSQNLNQYIELNVKNIVAKFAT